MRVTLLNPQGRVDVDQELPENSEDVIHDLALDTIFSSMSHGDAFIHSVVGALVLSPLIEPEEIQYRQEVVSDALENSAAVRELYAMTLEAVREEQSVYWLAGRNTPSRLMHQSPRVITIYVRYLKRLAALVQREYSSFTSRGWRSLFDALIQEVSPDYLAELDEHLSLLAFKDGTLLSANLGFAGHGVDLTLRDPRRTRAAWRDWLHLGKRTSYSFDVPPRDEAGAAALEALYSRGVNSSANALRQAADHLSEFFRSLRTQTAFLVGCVNLAEDLASLGEPLVMPTPVNWSSGTLECEELYDACLALRQHSSVVGNRVSATGVSLLVITGANSGGKSTFLRSVGVAYVLLRAGMFVPASHFAASVGTGGVFTHFLREEDATMSSGKLDEELSRMSEIVRLLTPQSLILFNESFSATNEREGSEIARQVISALIDTNVRAVLVTHLYDLANYFNENRRDTTHFLQARRDGDGARRFELSPGAPLPTSFGLDVLERLGGW